ncbi:MAG: response regulator [Candidatus Paceibacterota bacterium]
MISITQKPTLLQSILSTLDQTNSETQNTTESVAKLSKGKILLVDDDTFLLDMYSKRLKNEGYEAITCSSADEALEVLRSGNKVDLMLIDIIMPGMSGFEFMQTMKEENLDQGAIKIVLSNMGDQSEAIEKGNNLGVTKYLVKAESTPSDVLGLVDRMLA